MESLKNASTENLNGVSTNQLKRSVGFADIFFMSFGGQAPFLSMLTYATAALLLATFFSPVVLIIGTLVVLINGAGVYYLSKKHDETGGYFNYAYKSLSHRFGFETGWLYLFYSLLYAGGYVTGSIFVLTYVVSPYVVIPPLVAFLIVFIPTATFLLLGIKPSSKYAVFSASLELIVLVGVIVAALYGAHFLVYNPLISVPSPSVIFLGILFAIGIPTGYGAITPVSGEVQNAKKNVGKAAIMVIVIGGLLESLVLYSLVDYGLATHSFSTLLTTNIPVITIMYQIVGPYALPLLLFAAINDGILGSLAFFTAFSRNLYAMSDRGIIHKKISELNVRTGTPVIAGLITLIAALIILVPTLTFVNSFIIFLALGSIAGLGNLIVHLTANFSLFKVNLVKAQRKIGEFGISLLGIIISGFVFIYSLLTSDTYMIELVLGFIIMGFIILEILDVHQYVKTKTVM
ncbi:APC family permease [Ferroplasma sp.]|uniref:APC family permease n=1 Tax=Ferroplasma sp. TaxID=2591003 RepID=UPI00260716FA|nr:APC family permease [Ferroplasma sp.]